MDTPTAQPLVLVVEDYQDAREMYAAYLSFSGYRVAEATNGVEAIEKTIELLPDIILMDLALPRMDGWEATRRLKLDERTKHIPIVALTGHALAGYAEGARQAGCDAFVTKPCLPDALVAEIQRMLSAKSESGRRENGTTGSQGLRLPATLTRDGQDDCAEEGQTNQAETAGGSGSAGTADRRRRGTPQARSGKDALTVDQPGRGRIRRGLERGQVRLLHHQDRNALGFGPLGIGAEPAETHTVNFRDIAAVVSKTPMVVQDPTRDNVLAHQRVNETVMQKHTVIPMSFGTVFKTDDDIIELLRSAYDAFIDVLNKMQDKFEFGLKVLWDRDQIIREIEEEDEDIRRLKSEISSQKGSTYFARMQCGR